MLLCIGDPELLNDRCSPKQKPAALRQKNARPSSARAPSSTSYCSAELDQRVTDLLTKFNVIAPTTVASSSGCSNPSQKKRPQSARAWVEQRVVEANPSQAFSSSCASNGSSQLKRRPQSAMAHTSSASKASGRPPKRPQSAMGCEKRLADKDHLTVADAQQILAVLLDLKQRQQGQAYPVLASEHSPSSRTGSYASTRNESWMKVLGPPSKGYTSSRGVSESTRASTEHSSDVFAALHRLPREWLESGRGSCAKSHNSPSYYSYGDTSGEKTPRPPPCKGCLDEQGAGSPTTHLPPALWHLQTGPERALWGRHKKAYEHGNHLFQTGAWANRMGTGTGSIQQYRQWGPSGPQFAIDAPKHRR